MQDLLRNWKKGFEKFANWFINVKVRFRVNFLSLLKSRMYENIGRKVSFKITVLVEYSTARMLLSAGHFQYIERSASIDISLFFFCFKAVLL